MSGRWCDLMRGGLIFGREISEEQAVEEDARIKSALARSGFGGVVDVEAIFLGEVETKPDEDGEHT